MENMHPAPSGEDPDDTTRCSDGEWLGSGQHPALDSRVPILSGTILDGKYRIQRELGKGGMGAVYLATHIGTTRTVAVKVIIPEYAARNEFIVRFQREAAATGQLRHPNVVNVTDFGVADAAGTRLAYLVMEYLDGKTLAEHQKERGQMPLDEVLDVVEQIALAVDAAHAAGIVHRDLKPDNVWMEPNRRGGYNVKVLDFGIAKIASDAPEQLRGAISPVRPPVLSDAHPDRTITVPPAFDGQPEAAETKTRVGAVIGTPAYMCPEQCLGVAVDYRADIYSLALIAYELVSGKRPFAGATAAEVLRQQIETPAPSPRQFDPNISKAVADAVLRGLEKNPANRPASAGALAALLRAVVEGEFSILRKGKDIFQSYSSVFGPLWIAVFSPMVLFMAVIVLALPAVSRAHLVSDSVLVIGFYVAAITTWLFCAHAFKAAATLQLLEASSVGAFRPATSVVVRQLIAGLPNLLRTQLASLLDLRAASLWENQLWPVVWAVEGRTGRDALKRSQEISRTVPAVSLTLSPRFYSPGLEAVLIMPALMGLAGGLAVLKQSVLSGGPAGWVMIIYLLLFSRIYVLYGTAFPFFYWFGALCRGEGRPPALPTERAARERKHSIGLRPSLLIWWGVPVLLACMVVFGLVRRVH